MPRFSCFRLNCILAIVGGGLFCGPSVSPVAAAEPAAVVVDPLVKTDKSIDTSTVDSILADLIKKDMTDEQKVLACFNWLRRVVYHGDGPKDLAYDFHRMINVMGNGSCLRQTTPLGLLLTRLGYEAEGWTHEGHHMMQVKYGGKWHCLDPHMCFYVYDRSNPPTIASIEQLRADPSLALDAVKEKRACPGFLLCGDSPTTFAGEDQSWDREGPFPKLAINEPFGKISLPRGASYVRTWQPDAYWFKRASWLPDSGPYHTCGRRDAQDLVNWPLYEPHAATMGKTIAYRHEGSGRIDYRPDLRTDHYLDAALQHANLKHDAERGLVAVESTKPGELVLGVNCPYAITASELSLRKPAQGAVAAALSIDGGQKWQPFPLTAKDGRLTGIAVDAVNGSSAGYQLQLRLEGGATLDDLQLSSHFQLNPYSLPYLVPGQNEITVGAGSFGSPLTLEWKYAEGPTWTEIKTASRQFTQAGKFTIDVGGEKYPRNVALSLSVAP